MCMFHYYNDNTWGLWHQQQRKCERSSFLALCEGNPLVTPIKGQECRKHDIIIEQATLHLKCTSSYCSEAINIGSYSSHCHGISGEINFGTRIMVYFHNSSLEQYENNITLYASMTHAHWNTEVIKALYCLIITIVMECMYKLLKSTGLHHSWCCKFKSLECLNEISGKWFSIWFSDRWGWWGISCEIAIKWKSMHLIDDKSTLVQVMTWCH